MAKMIEVRVSQKDIDAIFSTLPKEQLPFATSLALTRLAQDAQKAVLLKLPEVFELRSTWTQKGIRIHRAEKKDWPFAFSVVGSRDEYLVQHEVGGIKAPKRARELALPGKEEVENLRGAGGRIPKSRRPQVLLQRKGRKVKRPYFFNRIRNSSKNAGLPAILQREGKARYPLRVIYVFRPRAVIKPELGMQKTVEYVVRAEYPEKFLEALSLALGSARRARPG